MIVPDACEVITHEAIDLWHNPNMRKEKHNNVVLQTEVNITYDLDLSHTEEEKTTKKKDNATWGLSKWNRGVFQIW